jgi:plastocyanin
MNAGKCWSLVAGVAIMATVLAAAVPAYAADKKKSSKDACPEVNVDSLCTAENTCGSGAAECSVDVKRAANGVSVTANAAKPKSNALFCVKPGTTVTWNSTSKNTGFVLDFGSASPFESEDAIIGGAKKPVSLVAKKPGCYKYSAGACLSGAIYGMCGSGNQLMVVTAGN